MAISYIDGQIFDKDSCKYIYGAVWLGILQHFEQSILNRVLRTVIMFGSEY